MKRYLSIKQLYLSLFALLFICSCSSSIPTDVFINDFNIDSLGTIYSETIYKFKEPIAVFEMKNQNDSMKILVYRRIYSIAVGAISGVGSFYSYDFSAAAFKNDKLFYWGFLDDFKKEDDPLIQLLGEKVSEIIIKGE